MHLLCSIQNEFIQYIDTILSEQNSQLYPLVRPLPIHNHRPKAVINAFSFSNDICVTRIRISAQNITCSYDSKTLGALKNYTIVNAYNPCIFTH